MTVYIVDLEAVETRYTAQWKTHVPKLIKKYTDHTVKIIDGPTDIPPATSPGAFLNFGGTNIYKASQVEKISRLFCENKIKEGDHFVFTDAWHPGIINLKYMSELLVIPVTIHALWHAGSYDPEDFLGRLIGDEPWVRHAEKSFYNAIDHNYFASHFHINMFVKNLLGQDPKTFFAKVVRTGWPMDYMPSLLSKYKTDKQDMILFPHRVAPEKQVDIFDDLAKELGDKYEFVVCQRQELSKQEYHTMLGKSKLVFSANLQETLGISCYEGAIVGAIPMVPDRLSYSEMYMDEFKYPSEWTESWDSYQQHKTSIIHKIVVYMDTYNQWTDYINLQADSLTKKYFSAEPLLKNLRG